MISTIFAVLAVAAPVQEVVENEIETQEIVFEGGEDLYEDEDCLEEIVFEEDDVQEDDSQEVVVNDDN